MRGCAASSREVAENAHEVLLAAALIAGQGYVDSEEHPNAPEADDST
jgi:hypothetical protein